MPPYEKSCRITVPAMVATKPTANKNTSRHLLRCDKDFFGYGFCTAKSDARYECGQIKICRKGYSSMEDLFVYAILFSVGYDTWPEFSSTLDTLFLENSDNTDLLELEYMQPKDAILHTLSLMNTYEIDIGLFGKSLMREINKLYADIGNLSKFSCKMYEIWKRLPVSIEYGTEPFFTLNYAGDCLDYGDEKQCVELFEKAVNFYN